MIRVTVLAVLLFAITAQAVTTVTPFNFFQCYEVDPSERMPNTLDNLIAILEKFESTSSNSNLDEVAEKIISRYRKDGIVYGSSQKQYVLGEDDKEKEKQELIEAIVRPTKNFEADTFTTREECGLHMMVSHSTDKYPFAGVDALWDGTISRTTRGDRKKRSTSSDAALLYDRPTGVSSRWVDTSTTTYAVHPLERGVMETPYGPVAAGTLLTGLMAMNDKIDYNIKTILQESATEDLPAEMLAKTLTPVYSASLAGDLGQMALHGADSRYDSSVGPFGRYHNCTTCAQQFSLDNIEYSYLSRAELYAGLDVLIINAAYTESSSNAYSSNLKLSQLLRMYYSDKGLPGKTEYQACNRMQLYNILDKDKLKTQALNFMYAYQNDFATIHEDVMIKNDQFAKIEEKFTALLTPAIQAMERFIESYNYDDEGYGRCSAIVSNSKWGNNNNNNNNGPPSEVTADIVAIYAQQGTVSNMRDQRQMIADVARRIGVSTERSRLGIMRGDDGSWIYSFTNISNIGDFACNFTTDTSLVSGRSASGYSIIKVVEQLSIHYQAMYETAMQDLDTSSGRSLVVLWQVSAAMPGDLNINKDAITTFRRQFPDVSIVFVGRNKSPYDALLLDDDDFISYSNTDLPTVVEMTVRRIQTCPKFFLYPSCDTRLRSNYRESSHKYEGVVSPNFTTYIRIPARSFHYSEELQIKVTGDVRSCFSRTNRLALEDYSVENLDTSLDIQTDTPVCVGGPTDDEEDTATYEHLCDRDLNTCNHIYISITGLGGTTSRSSCSAGSSMTQNICEYPNQIKYELSHTGMTCGSSSITPALLLLLLPAFLQYFMH